MLVCERCERSLPPEAFAASPALYGGAYPWCKECCAAASSSSDPERRAAYQRSYMRRRREVDGASTRWLRITVQGRGRMLARWSVAREEVRITGPFSLREDALRVLTGPFSAAVGDVRESGEGGGKGARRQKTFSTRAPLGSEAWASGSALLLASGVARERRRG